jgi:hypothetical protein
MRRTALAVALVLLASMTALSAQEASKFSINVGTGFALPLNTGLSDNYKPAFHLGGTVNFAVMPSLLVFVDARFHSFSGLKSGAFGYPSDATVTGGEQSVISVVGGVKYMIPSAGSFHFYVFGGAGLNLQSTADVTARYTIITPYYTQTVSETFSQDSTAGLGIILGPGILVDLGPKFSFFGEFRYASCIGTNMYLPIVVGVLIKI